MTALAERPAGAPAHLHQPSRRDPSASELSVRHVARAMVVLQVLVVSWACFRGFYYFHDDFVFRGQGAGYGWLDPTYVFQDWGGHFMPAAFAVAQPLSRWSNFEYGWTALSLALGQALVAWLLLRLLLRHFGARWRILLPLGLYLTSVPVVQASTWWAAALNMLPLLACLVLVADHTLRTRALRSWSSYAWILGVYVAGLLFFEKAVLLPFVVGMLLFSLTPGTPWRASLRVLRTHWPLLVGLVLVTVPWVVAYRMTHVGWSVAGPSLQTLVDSASETTVNGFLPALLGGGWEWFRATDPGYDLARSSGLVQWAAAALALVGFAFLMAWGPRARRALALALLYATVSVVLVTMGRPVWAAPGSTLPRYFADLAPVLAIALALATARLVDDPAPSMLREWRPRPSSRLVVTGLVLGQVVVLLWVTTVVGLVNLTSISPARVWTTTALRSLHEAEGSAPLLTANVPASVVNPLLRPYNDYHWFFAGVTGIPAVADQTDRLRILDPSGSLVDAHVVGPSGLPGPQPQCGWRIDTTGGLVPMSSPIIYWAHTVQIAYVASGQTDLEVSMAQGESKVLHLTPGLHDVFFNFAGGGSSFLLRTTQPGTSVCVGPVRVGVPVAGPLPTDAG